MARAHDISRIPWRLIAVAVCFLFVTPALAELTVNSTGDGPDSNPGDGICDDGTGDCTLRAAIEEANASAGADTITFEIPGAGPHTIGPGSALPFINDPVVIDATTGANRSVTPVIELDGTHAGSAHGLELTVGNSTVRGLVINRFDLSGILLFGSGASGNLIEGNFIGTDAVGTVALGNGTRGVRIIGGSNNTIGGTAVASRNVISGNGDAGVLIEGNQATGNVMLGNFIGTDVTGTSAVPNGVHATQITNGASNNTIGGTAMGAGNLLSGNGQEGVKIQHGATGNFVLGNLIGTDVTGTVSLGNNGFGAVFIESAGNTIGGDTPGARNVISGNAVHGVLLKGSGATATVVAGNYIGTQADGIGPLGNGHHGVCIEPLAINNVIGGFGVTAVFPVRI